MKRTFYVAGVQFRPKGDITLASNILKEGDKLFLLPEPTNKFDPNAVRIIFDNGGVQFMLGFVPKKFSASVSAVIEVGVKLDCILTTFNPSAKPWEMLEVEIVEVKE